MISSADCFKIIHNKLQESLKHIISEDHNGFSRGRRRMLCLRWPVYNPNNRKKDSKRRGNEFY